MILSKLTLHLASNFDKDLVPIPASKFRNWWDDNTRTKDHAKHCLPLQMANSLGYFILSPGTFLVKWDGDIHSEALITPIDKSSHYEVDSHAAFGSFTVQAKFIPVTEKPGEFVIIKGIANERGCPYSCMEAAIEAWWNVGSFGLVFLLNQPGEFMVNKGQPIAQMFVYDGVAASTTIDLISGYPIGHDGWLAKRSRPDYTKDLDYFRGSKYTGEDVPSHITNWSQAVKFRQ